MGRDGEGETARRRNGETALVGRASSRAGVRRGLGQAAPSGRGWPSHRLQAQVGSRAYFQARALRPAARPPHLARISHHVSSGAPAWSRLGIPERPKPVTDRRSDRSGIQADGEKCGLAVGAEVTRPYGQGRQGLLTPTPTALREPQLSLFIQPPLRPPANCLIFIQPGAYDVRGDAIGMFQDAISSSETLLASPGT